MTVFLNDYIDKLQKKRKELHISYDELVTRTKLPKTTITNTLLKYFKNSPSKEVLNKLAIALDEPCIDDIAQGVDPYNNLTALQQELLMYFDEIGDRLGSEAQKGLITYAKFIAEGNK